MHVIGMRFLLSVAVVVARCDGGTIHQLVQPSLDFGLLKYKLIWPMNCLLVRFQIAASDFNFHQFQRPWSRLHQVCLVRNIVNNLFLLDIKDISLDACEYTMVELILSKRLIPLPSQIRVNTLYSGNTESLSVSINSLTVITC